MSFWDQSVVSADFFLLVFVLAFFAPCPSSVVSAFAVGTFNGIVFPMAPFCQEYWYFDLWIACSIRSVYSASGSWVASDHAPVRDHRSLEFAVVDWGVSGPEVLLYALIEQGKSRGSVKAAKSISSFGKYVAGIEEQVRVTRSVIFLSLYAVILFSALLGKASGHAPRPWETLLWVLRNAFSESSLPLLISVIGLLESLRAWVSLHHDDQRGIRPGGLVVSAGSLHGEVWRSKAAGCDKMVQSRPIVIPPMSNMHDSGWPLDGRDLRLDFCTSLRGFLIPTSIGGATSSALAP